METLDILIPSFRVDPDPLLAALTLDVPANTKVRWIIVIDNPIQHIPEKLVKLFKSDSVQVIRNDKNLGSAGTRNIALDKSRADWILFLDDDVYPDRHLLTTYAKAVSESPNAIGFFGPTEFDKANTVYQRGVEISDILTFFWIAHQKCTLQWAPTSNVLVRGDLARSERFRTVFPKGGGGEDIDYLLRVSERGCGEFYSVPNARVYHPWWFEGKRNYSRFIRWSYGDSLLHEMHPKHVYRSCPNAVEVLTIILPFAFLLSYFIKSVIPVVSLLIGVIFGELIVEFARLTRLKGIGNAFYCIETILIRSSNDIGRLLMQVRTRRLKGITEHWDHYCNGKHIAYHKQWTLLKCIGYAVTTALAGWLLTCYLHQN